jgi:DNA-binding transcriptional LysR family regulator
MRVNAVDLRDIEYFAVIAEQRHLGRAAEALGLSTAALSKSLRRLEQLAQAKLVRRTPKGVELTAVGQAVLAHVEQLRLARNELMREVSDVAHGRAGNLRVGTGPATAENTLPAACSALLNETPKVTLSVTVANNDVMMPELRKGKLDLVVNFIPESPFHDLAQDLLWEDEFVVHASINHRLAGRRRVTLDDLVHERWTVTAASAFLTWQSLHYAFQNAGLPPPHIALVSESVMLRLRTVAATDLLGLVPKRTIDAAPADVALTILPVLELNQPRRVGVFYRKDGYLSPAALRFIEIIKAVARDSQANAVVTAN